MIKKLIAICLVFISILMMSSCSKYKFAKQTVFVEDVDKFFDPKNKLNVWLYMNFVPLENSLYGLRTKSMYTDDEAILKFLKLNNKKSRILFSAVPSQNPKYHLIALVHTKTKELTDDYKKQFFENAHYFQRDFQKGRLDIRHVYIPFDDNKKGLSLVYYISGEQHVNCRFCKLDYLSKINSKELQSNSLYLKNWIISDNEGPNARELDLKIPSALNKIKERLFLKIFAQYENATGINYFHILDQNDRDQLKLKLLPNTYYAEYINAKNGIVHRDTIVVK